MTVDTKCASQHVRLSLQGSHHPSPSADSGDAALLVPAWPSQQQQQQGGAGMELQVAIECFVISVWDDERRRLLGGPSQGTSAELCCICWDCLNLCLSRLPSTGQKLHPSMPCHIFVLHYGKRGVLAALADSSAPLEQPLNGLVGVKQGL